MNISYDQIAIPDHLRVFVRELTPSSQATDIPPGWDGLIIYHPATNQYYSTKSINPLEYCEILRTRYPNAWWQVVAVALKNMLNTHPQFQAFVLNRKSRGVVEKWLLDIGKTRVATKMGQTADGEHILFKVYSHENKVTRYVSAPAGTSKDKLIEQANISMRIWLASKARMYSQERSTMRVALRSMTTPNPQVFEDEAIVTCTSLLRDVKHSQFRRVSQSKNLEAIREFISNTVCGQ